MMNVPVDILLLLRVLLEFLTLALGVPIPWEMIGGGMLVLLLPILNGIFSEIISDSYQEIKKRVVNFVRCKRISPNMSGPEKKDLPLTPAVLYAAGVQTNFNQLGTSRLGHRCTVQEAAEILGTTVDGVRSRIRRGSLNSIKVSGTVYVLLDPDQSGPVGTRLDQSETSPTESGMNPLLEAKEETIADLREQVAYLREQLGQEREANGENRRIIAGLVQRVPELEAPSATQKEHDISPYDPEDMERRTSGVGSRTSTQATEETRRPWWIRWFGS